MKERANYLMTEKAIMRSSTDLVFVVPRVFKESSVEDTKAVQPVSLFRFLVAALSRAVVAATVWGGCEGGLSITAVVERTIFARAVDFEKKFSPSALRRDGLRWFWIRNYSALDPKDVRAGAECGNEVVPQPV